MDRPHVHQLSPREQEVLELVALGLTNQEIGNRLVIEDRTVRTHVSNILSKLCLNNRTEAALYVWRQQNVRPPDVVLLSVNRLIQAVRDKDVFGFLTSEIETADQWVKEWSR